MEKYLSFYKKILGYEKIPDFLEKYLEVPSLQRLKKIGYFCGMDYASKDVYDFKAKVSRFDHSLTVALLTYYLTNDKIMTLAGLFHDISTPCFSHVIDYMNKDYSNQESTEEYTKHIIKKDELLMKYLKEDNILLEEVADFKKYSIVDNDRPKMCADRLDGILLTGYFWIKNISLEDIFLIVNNILAIRNENNELEISFTNDIVANLVYETNEKINEYCHSNEDNYMMNLLSIITKEAINKKVISYEDLFILTEDELIERIKKHNDLKLNEYLNLFENIKIEQIPKTILPDVKQRKINPLVLTKRLIKCDKI